MFDNFSVYPETKHVTKEVTVHEYKAPTDDSARLYGELLEKAKQQIADAILIDSNSFKGAATVFRNHLTAGYEVRYRFELNDQLYSGCACINTFEAHNKQKQELLELIAVKLSKAITAEIMPRLAQEFMRGF